MEIFLYSHANKTHFHNNCCALGLILKVRVFGTRTWPITYLHIRQSSQCAKECHGLAAAWWAAKNHGLMFSQPRVQECFMSHCVYCWHDNIRCCDFVSLHFNLRHLGLPQHPFTLNSDLETKDISVNIHNLACTAQKRLCLSSVICQTEGS